MHIIENCVHEQVFFYIKGSFMYFVLYIFGVSKDMLFVQVILELPQLCWISISTQERHLLVYLACSTQSASDTFSAHEWARRWSGLVRCLHFWGALIRSLQTHAACAGRPSESRYESNNGAPSQSDGSFVRSTKHDRSVKWGTTFLGRPTCAVFTTFLWENSGSLWPVTRYIPWY